MIYLTFRRVCKVLDINPKVICRRPVLIDIADSRQVAFQQGLLKRAPTNFICICLQKRHTIHFRFVDIYEFILFIVTFQEEF